jgi:hypothetical protein
MRSEHIFCLIASTNLIIYFVIMLSQTPKYPITNHISTAYIIAHKEPTEQLVTYFDSIGINCQVLRQIPTPEFQTYSPSYRCLLNHQTAWELIAQSNQPGLIIEADFVPVQNFGALPLPFDINDKNTGIAWLYTCAAQIYTVNDRGYAPGFSASTVAYILTPGAAQALLHLATELNLEPTQYSSWDCELEKFLRQKGFTNYVPFRNYGEHGGIPNPEHRHHGLSRVHRADTLYNPLAFMPIYAQTPWQYYQERTYARLKGIARLLCGKFLRPTIFWHSSVSLRLLNFAIQRQITINW